MNTVSLFNRVSYGCSHCVTHSYSTSFSYAIKLLHPDLRDHIYGIYGFVRLADEIVDSFHDYDKSTLLTRFQEETHRAIEQGISLNPILQSFQLTVNRYKIDTALIDSFFTSMRTDLEKKEWSDKQQLSEYIYGSAEVVGLMCLQVFCEGDLALTKKLSKQATSLGAAFQKVNFLRDLREDITGLGRQYFPGIDFKTFDPSAKAAIENDIMCDFQDAYEGICSLPQKARFGVMVAYRYYLFLFRKIKGLSPELLMQKRVRVPNFQKILLILQASAQKIYA